MIRATAIARDLWWVATSASNAYLWRDATGGVVVVDPGLPGDETAVLEALHGIGASSRDVRTIVLTHFHSDHAGATAALAELTGAVVAAGTRDAAVLRGEEPAPEPVLTELERPIYEAIARAHPENLRSPRCHVDLALDDGDRVGGPEALVVHAVPGHTRGSIALHLPALAAVLTGDLAITTPGGGTSLGPFNVDRGQARAALRRLAALHPEVAGLGHGAPLLGEAAATLAKATDAFAP